MSLTNLSIFCILYLIYIVNPIVSIRSLPERLYGYRIDFLSDGDHIVYLSGETFVEILSCPNI